MTTKAILDAIISSAKHQLATHKAGRTLVAAGFEDEVNALIAQVARNASFAISLELEMEQDDAFLAEEVTKPIANQTLDEIGAEWRATMGSAP